MKQKISIYTSLGTGTLEERLNAIRNARFDAVCLDFEAEMLSGEGSWQQQISLAEKYALEVETVHLTGDGMTDVWSEGEKGEFVTQRLIGELKELKAVGVSSGVCHVTWGHDKPHAPDRIGLNRFLRIAEAAEKYNVCLAVENSVYSDYPAYIFDNIDSKNIGFCYDSGHENAFTPDFDYLSKYGDRMIAMHLHDNNGREDAHAIPFSGTINWSEKVEKLKKTRLWQSFITLECHIRQNKSLDEDLEYIYGVAKRLGQM